MMRVRHENLLFARQLRLHNEPNYSYMKSGHHASLKRNNNANMKRSNHASMMRGNLANNVLGKTITSLKM